jgi:hypothetical protein
MKRMASMAYALMLSAMIIISGCESVALMPRPDVDRRDVDRGGVDRSGSERDRESRGNIQDQNRDKSGPRDEVVGTVESINTTAREIRLRTTEAQVMVIKYDPNLVVRSRDRELRVDQLRRGDLILVQVSRNSRGERYADLIRLNERSDMGSRSY